MTQEPSAPAAMPSIVFLNRFYWPDESATAQMLTDLAEDLAEAGWRVTVVTSRAEYRPSSRRLAREEVHRGVRIVRTWTTTLGARTLAGRVVDYAAYLVGALAYLLRGPKHAIIAAMTDPPLLIVLAVVVARLRRVRSVYWLQDLFPQIAAKLGVLRPTSLAYRLADRAARFAHRRTDLVITLGDRMADAVVVAGALPARTKVVHNWTDAQAVVPVPPRDNPFLRANGLEGKFVLLYSGNAGRAHTFDATLAAAERLAAVPEVVFVFIGSGPQMATIEARARTLPNVRRLGFVPREELRFSLSSATVSLVTEAPSVVGHLVPSKVYGILASGRPILFVGSEESDVAAIVRAHDCGVVVAPDDVDGLVAAIERLRASPAEVEAMGARARAAATERYDRRIATADWGRAAAGVLTR